jgi:hypothetical protein
LTTQNKGFRALFRVNCCPCAKLKKFSAPLRIPTTWIPTLRGYPDIGGAALIVLAILVYLKDTKLRHWKQILLIALLLALAILFRRHFAYSARAFLVKIFFQGFLVFFSEVRNDPRIALQNLTRYGIRLGLLALSILIFSPLLVYNVLTTNYRVLYSSYERSPLVFFQQYGEAYGWLTWILTLLGFSAGILTRLLVHPATSFITIFGSISLIQWGLFSRQTSIQYTTHFTFFYYPGSCGISLDH